jgi:hypothetical protein
MGMMLSSIIQGGLAAASGPAGWGAALMKYGLPSIVNFLAGRFGAGAANRQNTHMIDEITKYYSPEAILGRANQMFAGMQQSPMYTGLRRDAMTNASQLASNLNSSFYRRGLGTSGIAAVATPLAQSSFGNSFANIDSSLFAQALGAAGGNSQVSDIFKTRGPGIGGGTSSAFITSMLPLIKQWLSKYYPAQGS